MRLVCAPLSEKEGMEELAQRFRRLPRQLLTANLELDPSLNENLEQWPHLNELTHCYKADWVKDNSKYGHYETVGNTSFQNQVFEGPDTDIGTGMMMQLMMIFLALQGGSCQKPVLLMQHIQGISSSGFNRKRIINPGESRDVH
ncbi:guanine nucleotide exchange factor SPIKE 1-like isoform X5 [Nymphaea colorata]|uniref:guanine nucleotide exchange factor SPIKE 1-like isoform X5 n=1 Tax=Nymphaea colorata TaxID=210225 RepID=UPI00129DCE0B|nr:guanine nucleotide exchange factor SPIKE 1-like isoform X5 [Nymphaea colorata]